MGMVAVKIKVMPKSVETDIEQIKKKVVSEIEKKGLQNPTFEIQPIAFGLKAVIVMFGWPEEEELDSLEERLKKIKEISSVEVIDIRRAIG